MLDNLLVSLPRHRHQALEEERDRLDQAIKGSTPFPRTWRSPRVPDSQGLGGSTGTHARELTSMLDTGIVPQPLLTAVAAATIFTVMFALGLAIDMRDLRWAWARPWLVARGLVSVLVVVPIVGVAVARALGLSLAAQVGVALMAISPGAPVALRRSLDAGSRQSFAAVLQVLVALLAIVSMPRLRRRR